MTRRRRPRQIRRAAPRSGLSILEVMLAIAILGGAVAAIGELIRVGSRSAVSARELTSAQLVCENKMAELVTGQLPLEPVGPTASDTDPGWMYSVAIETVDQQGLLSIQLTVQPDQPPQSQPISFTLVRWMIDPESLAVTDEESP